MMAQNMFLLEAERTQAKLMGDSSLRKEQASFLAALSLFKELRYSHGELSDPFIKYTRLRLTPDHEKPLKALTYITADP